jgi:hypothetical protein
MNAQRSKIFTEIRQFIFGRRIDWSAGILPAMNA